MGRPTARLSCLPASQDESPSTARTDVACRRHGIEALRSRRASCSCFSTPTTSFPRTIWRDSSRQRPLLLGRTSSIAAGGASISTMGAFSTGRTSRSTSTGTPSTPLLLQVRRPSPRSPYVAEQRPASVRFDENESLQADWDYWLRLAASGATFQGRPGQRGDHPTPQRQHVSLGRDAARRCRPCRSRAASLASPTLPCLHLLGRGSPELATGCAPLVGPRLRAPASPRGPHGTADRRGRRGRASAASRVHSVAGATREATHRLRMRARERSAGAAV